MLKKLKRKINKIFIIGGGSSLKGFDFNQLKGKNVLAINRAVEFVPFAQILYFGDYKFYKEYKSDITSFSGLKYTLESDNQLDEDIIVLKNTGKYGFDLKAGCIKWGGNSGYSAINLAYHLGFNEIILMGFDMKYIEGSHFHSGYNDSRLNEETYKRFLKAFENFKIENINIYNTSLESALTVFPKKSIEEFL